jgi:hypothetical protein
MLRVGEQTFLDDITVSDVEKALGIKVMIVESGGKELIDAVISDGYRTERNNEKFVYIKAYDQKSENNK